MEASLLGSGWGDIELNIPNLRYCRAERGMSEDSMGEAQELGSLGAGPTPSREVHCVHVCVYTCTCVCVTRERSRKGGRGSQVRKGWK